MLKLIGFSIAKSFVVIVFEALMNCTHIINNVHAVIDIRPIYTHSADMGSRYITACRYNTMHSNINVQMHCSNRAYTHIGTHTQHSIWYTDTSAISMVQHMLAIQSVHGITHFTMRWHISLHSSSPAEPTHPSTHQVNNYCCTYCNISGQCLHHTFDHADARNMHNHSIASSANANIWMWLRNGS